MSLIDLETRMAHLLAKSKPRTTLFRHSMDVVRQMAEYYRIYQPKWPHVAPPVNLKRILAYAALVHDFGKVHTVFQEVLEGRVQEFGNRHEILSLCFLEWLKIPAAERAWIESAIALHHKNLAWIADRYNVSGPFGGNGTYAKALAQGANFHAAELLYQFLAHANEIFEQTGWSECDCYELTEFQNLDYVGVMGQALKRVQHLAEGFEPQSDDYGKILHVPWELRRAGIHVRGLILLADHLASAHPLILKRGAENVDDALVAIKRKTGISELNSYQDDLSQREGSALLVAPTGSGKTEAALLWAGKQAETGSCGRTFFLLPYQTSMGAMQRRLIDAFVPTQIDEPALWTEHVAMVHGKSVRTAYEQLLEKKYTPEEATRIARIGNDLARLDISPLRVCSPYQILRLLFEPKGVEGLMQSLSQSKLIFDEIHAYTSEVTALTLTATRFLMEQLGARSLFMTATMPAHLFEVIQDIFGDLPTFRPGRDVMDRPTRHRLQILPYDVFSPTSIAEITKEAKNGSVLIVVNQVKRAIELYNNLKPLIHDIGLLHSRFTNEHRFKIEKELQPHPGRVLVATQAVEVSLDVSYDVCFSELAPLESLLQRFGRCNRYGEPGLSPARVFVYATFPKARNPHKPYDSEHLEATRKVLERCVKERDGLLAEMAVQAMLNDSYPESLKSQLKQQISRKSKEVRNAFDSNFAPFGQKDQSYYADLAREWEELFDGHEVLPESFVPEATREESWLARARYLVPISAFRFRVLRAAKKIEWWPDLMCHTVRANYTDCGLEL
jgi:CRISPR-associated endonuclease/helicase Cas3